MRTSVLLLAFWLGTALAGAQQNYVGGLVVQDFDSLPAADTFDLSDFLPADSLKGPAQLTNAPLSAMGATGWSIYARVGTPLLFLVGNGGAGTASVYSFGHHATSDRALGSLGSSTHAANLGWRLVNTTGQTLTGFTISFYAEQWRNGGTALLTGFTGEYRLAASGDINAGAYIAEPAMDAPAVSAVAGSGFSMNGNSPANRTERSATVTGLTWTAGQMLILRWFDENEGGADNGLALDDVIFHAPTIATLPQVHSVRPAAGSVNVFGTTPAVITFNQPVTASGVWFEISGSLSGPLAATVSNAGPMRYTLTPTAAWPAGETITVRVVASQVVNSGAQPMAADHFSTFATLQAASNITPISTVQGADGSSPLTGAAVTVEGVVTASFQGASPALGGFYLQEEAADADGNAATSEALWVGDFGNAFSVPVAAGDRVRVSGAVSESGSLTQLINLTAVSVIGTAALPTPAAVALPAASTIALERYEGMLATLPQTLTVSSNSGSTGVTDNYSRFGELTLSADGVHVTPTEFMDPNDVPASGVSTSGRGNVPAIHAYERQLALRSLLLDDASSAQYPDPTPYLNAQGTRRCGDTVTGLGGILTYTNGAYRVHPTGVVSFVDANPRPVSPPAVGGSLKVGAMNVLNYFITFGGANDRGATDAAEFQRQKDKVVAALAGLDADIIGLMEIQNSNAAVADLLAALNAVVADDYALVPDPPGGYPAAGTGADYIRCVLLYRPSRVSLFGDCQMDTNVVWLTPNPLRLPLAQVFQENSTGERCVVCVNHWKSKSSVGSSGLNTDQNDGQAAFNDLRKQQAARLHTWLQGVAASVGDNDLLIIGDLNSHGEEDPLDVLRGSGWADQGQRFHGTDDYSYRIGGQRGRLDHAFATTTLAAQITGLVHWHINADEPAFYDYNMENKTPGHLLVNAGTPFRSSDHDPVLLGLNLTPQLTTYAMWAAAEALPGAAAAADNDLDGAKNLLEFALGADPGAADSHLLPVVVRSGNFLHLDYRLRTNASGLTVTPQWSDDLVNWHDLTGSFVSTLDSTTALHRASFDATGEGRIFMRLRVVVP